jgi:hypothetical protein
MENLRTDASRHTAAIARWEDEGEAATLTEGGRQSCHIHRIEQPSYRVVPRTVVRYGVEVSEPNKLPRVVLACSTEAAAETWVAELQRLRAAKEQFDQKFHPVPGPPQVPARENCAPSVAPITATLTWTGERQLVSNFAQTPLSGSRKNVDAP